MYLAGLLNLPIYLSIYLSIWPSLLGLQNTPIGSPQRGKTSATRQSDGETLVMHKLWGMRSAPSLPLLPSPL